MKNVKETVEEKEIVMAETSAAEQYDKFIRSLKAPAVSPEVKAAESKVAEKTAALKEVAASGDVEKIMTASAEVAAATRALDRAKDQHKVKPITMAEIAAMIACRHGWKFDGTRGEVDAFARACVRVMRDATGEEMALAATRTVSQSLVAASRMGLLEPPTVSAVVTYLKEQVGFTAEK